MVESVEASGREWNDHRGCSGIGKWKAYWIECTTWGINYNIKNLKKSVKELENEMIKKDEKLREYIKYNKLIEDFNSVNNGKDSLKDSQLYVITLKGVLKFVEFL